MREMDASGNVDLRMDRPIVLHDVNKPMRTSRRANMAHHLFPALELDDRSVDGAWPGERSRGYA